VEGALGEVHLALVVLLILVGGVLFCLIDELVCLE
jgi:hypothetical protein